MAKQTEVTFPKDYDVNEAAAQAPQTEQAVSSATTEKKEYTPDPKVVSKLNTMPKDEIKKEFGIDIDKLITNTNHYGILEALAYGRFTPPLPYELKTGHQIVELGVASFRFIPALSNGGSWNMEIQRVTMKEKRDANGEFVLDRKGNRVKEIDHQELKPQLNNEGKYIGEQEIKYRGVTLTDEQVRHLRLTGNLGEPLKVKGYKGEEMEIFVSVNPYNNQKLVSANASYLKGQLSTKPTIMLRGGAYANLNQVISQDGTTALQNILAGGSAWVDVCRKKGVNADGTVNLEPTGKKVCLQFNAFEGKVKPCTDYAYSLAKDQKEVEGKTQEKPQAQTQAPAPAPQKVFTRE